jgi:BirA family transcriptional regulator, biotin operon repressor / biotin---[acetyl-CoA-carboxylase] ligase
VGVSDDGGDRRAFAADLSEAAVFDALAGRPVRSYPAILSTETDAIGWARAGGPTGSVVVAGYQASARGRGGYLWDVRPDEGLGFSVILRPELEARREGWPYIPAALALAELADPEAIIRWPDEVVVDGEVWATVAVQVELGDNRVEAAVVSAYLPTVEPPRAPVLADAVELIEAFMAEPEDDVIEAFVDRCETIGRSVTAHIIPVGPTGERVTGLAVDVKADGALVLRSRENRRMAVPPHVLGLLEEAL